MVGEFDIVSLAATGDLAGAAKVLTSVACVKKASVTGDGIDLVVERARENLPGLLEWAAESGAAVRSVVVTEPDLEAVFLHLTGRALRD
jgi:ABC-2 type transport system ATP-binding protein